METSFRARGRRLGLAWRRVGWGKIATYWTILKNEIGIFMTSSVTFTQHALNFQHRQRLELLGLFLLSRFCRIPGIFSLKFSVDLNTLTFTNFCVLFPVLRHVVGFLIVFSPSETRKRFPLRKNLSILCNEWKKQLAETSNS